MTIDEIINGLEDQAQDKDSLAGGDPESIFTHDANVLTEAAKLLKTARPLVHARWVKPVPGDGENYCSACKAEQPWFAGYGYFEPDHCPYCGAKMDLEV